MTQQGISNQTLTMETIHLQRLRLALLVHLNRVYPKKLDCPSLSALQHGEGQRTLVRELHYLKELGFVRSKRGERWRISALGRDFLLGMVEANGIMQSAMLDSRGEE